MFDFILFINRLMMFIALFVFLWIPLKQSLHMFQQNRYELRRYGPWLRDRLKFDLKRELRWAMIVVLYVLISLASYFIPVLGSTLWLVFTLILAYFAIQSDKQQKFIKKLHYTSRVKRQMVVMFVLMGLVILGFYQLQWFLISLLTPIMVMMVWLMIYVMAILTLPFEALVKHYYIHKARQALDAHPRLIKIGITGSYGKTSSKNILNEILSERYYVLSTPASFNTPMGLTITISEQLKAIHQVFIAEMGADKVGEINFLSKFIRPHYAIVTAIGPQHLNTFKTLENIQREKMRLIENLPVNGVGVINYDYATIRDYRIKNNCKIVTYALDHEADFKAINIQYSQEGSTFDVVCLEGTYAFETRLLGKHNIGNILAGIALGRQLGLDWANLQKAVMGVNYVEHRLQLKKINGFNYIDNAFNSNPEGAKMSLEVMKMMPNHRYIITPGMIDLGHEQDAYNKAFGRQMLTCVDTVILVGKKQTQAIYEGLVEVGFDLKEVLIVDTVKEAFAYIETNASRDDMILLENDLPDAFNR